MTNNSTKYQPLVYTQLNDQTILYQTNLLKTSHLFVQSLNAKQVYLTHYRTLSGVTPPGQSGPDSNGNKGVINIPQKSVTS